MAEEKIRVVIAGGGFAGLNAARALRRRRDVEVTLIDRTNHHLFQPLLYQVATAGLNPSEIASPIRALLRRQGNVTVIMGSLTGVDRENRVAEVDYGELSFPYDYLVLAMGGRTSYFGHDEWEEHAPGLKTLEDALAIRQQVLLAFERAERSEDAAERERLMTMVVVGGGPTGVELAGALAELRRHVLRWDFRRIDPEEARVVLLEGSPRLLAAFPERLAENARRRLEKLGVEVLLDERVEELKPRRVRTAKRTLEAETILWAAGVEGHPMAAALGWETDSAGRIKVAEDLRVVGEERIYCVGDMACFEAGGKPLPGLAPVAMQQGAWAARNLLLHAEGKPPRPFRYRDKGTMATIGRSAAIAEIQAGTSRGSPPGWPGSSCTSCSSWTSRTGCSS